MQYEVKNAPLPVLICKLDPNESIECQKGAMSWMTPTMQMQTGLGSGGGGLLGALGKMAKSAVTGESIFRNTYTAQGGAGEIAFASSFPGDIICFDTSANPIVAQKSSYLANTMGVNMEIFFQKKLGAGFFGGSVKNITLIYCPEGKQRRKGISANDYFYGIIKAVFFFQLWYQLGRNKGKSVLCLSAKGFIPPHGFCLPRGKLIVPVINYKCGKNTSAAFFNMFVFSAE